MTLDSTSESPFKPSAPIPSSNCQPSQPSSLLHRSLFHTPDPVVHASGLTLTLSTGRTILDACGGAAVSCIGHGNEEVIAATTRQMRSVSYVHTGTYTTSSAEELASHILSGNPYGLTKALFVSSGSEAMDAAMKLARQYHYENRDFARVNFVARKQSWHGTTLGALSVSSNLPRKTQYAPLLLPTVSHVSPAYAYQYRHHETESETAYVRRLIDELDAEFHRLGPNTVIAFIAEPVVGATTGCVPAPPGYFHAVRNLCDKYGILLIFDEVMCGMGRTGSYFAFEQETSSSSSYSDEREEKEEGQDKVAVVVPDILTIGKGLGGGYAPIAGLLLHSRIVSALHSGTGSFNHGHTYQAHPLSCATALAVQRIIRRDDLIARCKTIGALLLSALHTTLSSRRSVGDIRGRGLFVGIEFVTDKESRRPFEKGVGFGGRVQKVAFERGVAVYGVGTGTVDGVVGDHVLVAPAYTVTEEEVREVVAVLGEAVGVVEGEVFDAGG